MDDLVGGLAGGLGVIVLIFVIVLIVLWTLLPFAVFGTKKLLRQNLDAQEAILNELRMLNGKGPVDGAGSPDPSLLGMTPRPANAR